MIDLTPPFGASKNCSLKIKRLADTGGTDADGNPQFFEQETCLQVFARLIPVSDPRREQIGLGKDYNAYPLELYLDSTVSCNLEVGSKYSMTWAQADRDREGIFTAMLIDSDPLVDATVKTFRKVSGVFRT